MPELRKELHTQIQNISKEDINGAWRRTISGWRDDAKEL